MLLSAATFEWLARANALAPDGRSKAFSAAADGFGRGEGCAVIVLERLAQARANGDRVLAIIRGSAVNHDGASRSLTAPSATAQAAVIESALADAGCPPSSVAYVEAHGTGTPLGDATEIEALTAAYGPERAADAPLLIGSVKTNIGHLEYAAEIAGLIKVVLSLQHGMLPAHLHAESLSPRIPWAELPLAVTRTATAWPKWNHPRRAGVSSFGLSGTNAHVIVEEAPPTVPTLEPTGIAAPPLFPVLLSARSAAALAAQAERLRAHLEAQPDLALVDVAAALATTRTHFEHRAAIVADGRDDLAVALAALADGRPSPRVILGRAAAEGRVVFVFPGQGSQWPEMARSLLATSPVFRERIEACATALARHVDWSLLAVLSGEVGEGWLERVDVVQPALFAVMVALASLWRSLGVIPGAVLGHSQGELAAACVAGALSLDDAARVIALRSRAPTRIAGNGAMAAVELAADALAAHLLPFGQRLAIAAVNSPRETVVAGDAGAIDALVAALDAAQVFARKVRVDYASHSADVDAIKAELTSQLTGIAPRAATIPLYSTVTGGPVSGPDLDASYWFCNLRQPVRFADATQRLLADGYRFFIETSPHPVLAVALHHNLEAASVDHAAVVGSLRRGEGTLTRVLVGFAELHARGLPVDWQSLFAPSRARRVDLPTTPSSASASGTTGDAHSRSPTTGRRPAATAQRQYRSRRSQLPRRRPHGSAPTPASAPCSSWSAPRSLPSSVW